MERYIKITEHVDKIQFTPQIAMMYVPRRISTSVYLTEIQPDASFWDCGKSNIWTDCRVIGGLTRVAFYVKIGGFHAIHQRPRGSKERNIVRVSLYP